MKRRSSPSCRFESWSAVPGWTTRTLPVASSCSSIAPPRPCGSSASRRGRRPLLDRVDVPSADGAGRIAEEVRARLSARPRARRRAVDRLRGAAASRARRRGRSCSPRGDSHARPGRVPGTDPGTRPYQAGRGATRGWGGAGCPSRRPGGGAGGGVGGASVVAFEHGSTLAQPRAQVDSARWCLAVRSTALRSYGRTTRARARSAAPGGPGCPTASARGSRPGSAPARPPCPAAAAS